MRLVSLSLAVYWLAIFVGTHLPSYAMPQIQASDKLLHFGAYGGLAFLVAWAISSHLGSFRLHALWTIGLTVGYAMIDELTQNLIPGRTCSMGDFIADSIGAVLGFAAFGAAKIVLSRGVVAKA